MNILKKVICLSLALFCIFSACSVSASAAEEYMKGMDKGYITFIFDDNRSCTKELYQLFSKYNMPLSCAVIAQQVESNPTMQQTLMDIQNAGGEILSHTYSHKVITANNYDAAMVEEEFSKAYNTLTKLGFNVNGILEAGGGGSENTAPKDKIELITKKYYKYSDDYGVSPQYKKSRTWLSQGLSAIKRAVDKTATNKSWTILSAHDFGEMPKAQLENLLQYISENDNLEVVTWNYMYRTFGTNPEKITPTGKGDASLPDEDDDDNDTPTSNQNGAASNPQTPDKTPADDKGNVGDTTNKDTENNNTVNKDNTENSTTDNNSSNNTVLYSKEKTNLTPIIIFGVAALVLMAGTVVTLLILQNKKKKK